MQDSEQFAKGVMEDINSIRATPVGNAKRFEVLIPGLTKFNKGNDKLIKSFKDFVEYLKKASAIPKLQISPELTLAAKEQLEIFKAKGYSTTFDKNELSGRLGKYVEGFSLFLQCVDDGGDTYVDTVNRLMMSKLDVERVNRKLISDTSYKYIGCAHEVLDGNNVVVIIVADEARAVSQQPTVQFQDLLLEQLNRLRLKPNAYVDDVNNYKKAMSKIYSSKTALFEEIDKLAQTLSAKTTRPLPPFVLHEELSRAAEEHLDLMADSGLNKFYAQDDEYLSIALTHYIEGFDACKEFVTVDELPEDVVMSLLIGEGDSEKISRNSLLNKNLIYIGIAHGKLRGKPVTVLLMTDGAQPITQKPFLQDIVEEINKIRACPKSYVKFLISISEANLNSKKKIRPETIISLIGFLKKTRRYGPFTVDPILQGAAEYRAKQFDTSIAHRSEDDLRHFLEDFGSNFNVIAEYEGYPTSTGREFLLSMLINDVDNTFRNMVFSPKLTQIGVAQLTGDTVKDENKTVAVLFADHIDALSENLPITVLSHRRILMRPRFTDDELLQIKNDFKLLDVNNSGFIIPKTILLFVNRTNFADLNPLYYEALNLLNTDENNSNGVNVEEFINGIAKVIQTYNNNLEKWKVEFKTYLENNRKKTIDFDTMKEVTKQLGYNVMNEDLMELMERIDESKVINDNLFTQIMDVVENSNKRK